ncbi:hypothetical protein HWV62_25400, partial [Athelia sp. TMB]
VHWVHTGEFLKNCAGDPAIQDFIPKLKAHLVHRMSRTETTDSIADFMIDDLSPPFDIPVYFRGDMLYRHSILRVNYTTYDIRRKHDTINPGTSHCDIMLLSDREDRDDHPYLYARVLGIFHTNAVYMGPGCTDFNPRRMEFLWVRWYELVPKAAEGGWVSSTLDRLRFPPIERASSFGFLDPADVMRACHVMPHFRHGLRHADGKGLSPCAHDSKDWSGYLLNRFVDRDMLMRFHWGLGVGHVYAHRSPCHNSSVYKKWPGNCEDVSESNGTTNPHQVVEEEDGSDSEGEENDTEERRSIGSQDSDMDGKSDSEDEEQVVFYDMYGFVDSDGEED